MTPRDAPAVGFDWDPAKAARNAARHGITFTEAASVFDDPAAYAREDEDHSEREDRYHVIGRSVAGRLVTVCYTMRGEMTRIVSAWSAGAEDRREYREHSGD